MAGIVGYTGRTPCLELLLRGLERMEGMWYDSAGVSIQTPGRIESLRTKGKLEHLRDAVETWRRRGVTALDEGTAGIGHIRWATCGRKSVTNAHPHTDVRGRVHVALNGGVANHARLRRHLTGAGIVFSSDTDAEVVAHLIAFCYAQERDLLTAVRRTVAALRGSYAFVAMSVDEPGVLVGARKEEPLIAGIGEGEHFIASESAAFLPEMETRLVELVRDAEVIVLTPDRIRILDASGARLRCEATLVA